LLSKWLDLAIASGAGVLFLLISSPIWLTFLDTLSRSYSTYDAPQAFQIEPGMLAGLFDEAAVGLAIIIATFRTRETLNVDSVDLMKS